MSVIVLPEVQDYLDDLVPILYEKGYFGFEESAVHYVHELLEDIRDNLSTRIYKPAPPYFDRYGKNMYYAAFRKNRQTVWYAFFTKYNDGDDTVYLVRYIANNHVVARQL
jgi:hypothetical protein